MTRASLVAIASSPEGEIATARTFISRLKVRIGFGSGSSSFGMKRGLLTGTVLTTLGSGDGGTAGGGGGGAASGTASGRTRGGGGGEATATRGGGGVTARGGGPGCSTRARAPIAASPAPASAPHNNQRGDGGARSSLTRDCAAFTCALNGHSATKAA